ncbi:gluconokinase [Aeromicrobium phragmitis]|uniref:Gluconokinase n=1 Tax=Aeromicrobium phragmitis TaxID=2478914 RepID=A0A3L8PNH3_9ACTN|nr:gluconokinase [Aeromicrobium phragmitis]RLV56945.1 gluconokinase [Aeromicrobium phragmitis]
MTAPPLVVVMGISGTGKSAVGHAVADLIDVEYVDGDDFHPPANVEKMSQGVALTDEDRWPWLEHIGRWLAEHDDVGGVISCSALRRVYRDLLTRSAPRTIFLHLVGDHDLIRERMEGRDHFMPASLLQSQQDTLEPLEPEENGGVFDITLTPEDIARAFLRRYRIPERPV